MTGCCAVGCSNSSEKGFLMKRFPMDTTRRKLWAVKVKRENWTPTDSSCLCEVHFTEESFEQNRADGKKLLKRNAIPTLFDHIPQKKARKPPIERPSPRKAAQSSTIAPYDETLMEIILMEDLTACDVWTSEQKTGTSSSSSSISPPPTLPLDETGLKLQINQLNKTMKNLIKRNKHLENRLRQSRLLNKKLLSTLLIVKNSQSRHITIKVDTTGLKSGTSSK